MFNIDRSYIDTPTIEETLQSRIIFIRSKYKNDASLPKPEDMGLSDEEYEDYIDRKQDYAEQQKAMKRRGPIWLAILFCAPPVAVNFYDRSDTAFYLGFLASVVLVGIAFLLYKTYDAMMVRKHTDGRFDAFTDKLFQWQENNHPEEEDHL